MSTNEVEVYEPGQLERQELTVDALVERQQKIKEAMDKAMKVNVHYGRIPGTPKPTLYKAGAETLCSLFMFDPQYESATERDDDGHFHVKSKVTLYHIPTGNRVASGEGYCSTQEKRYAFKKGGAARPVAEFPELFNTILKMAGKRALVAAVLNATAASDAFTQDLEDRPSEAPTAPPEPASAATRADLQRELTLCAYAPDVWSEDSVVRGAVKAFRRPIAKVEDLTEDEAQEIIKAARTWREAHPSPDLDKEAS